MNGPWGVQGTPFGFAVGTFVQTGTDLSATIWGYIWTGTINPDSGGFTLNGPPFMPGCPGMRLAATANPAGTTFSGALIIWFQGTTPSQCVQDTEPVFGRRCGNGVVDAGEECDDANFVDGDCCSSTCVAMAESPCTGTDVCLNYACDDAGGCVVAGPHDGQPCDDGIFCNGVDVCSGGACVHGGDPCAGQGSCRACDDAIDECLAPTGTRCGPCRTCDAGACVGTPIADAACRPPGDRAGSSRLAITNRTLDTKDELVWKWKGHGTRDEFGMPTVDTGHAVCVFDASVGATPYPLLVAAAAAPGVGWTTMSTGFRYRSTTGLRSMSLRATLDAKASIAVTGLGDVLDLPTSATPFPLPLLVQLQSDEGECWQATFPAATANDGTKLRAKSPE
ncbi:MAG TPA: hypothetical protein VKA21_12185 [Candidatus Binatia bacterium]|nr:hypothetical protein [Candidatus Binatia bacterium]